MLKDYASTIPLHHLVHSKLTTITCNYASNEEEIVASKDLGFYVVMCFVGCVSYLDFTTVEQHNESTTKNQKNRAFQGVDVTLVDLIFLGQIFAFMVRN
jgi:hypothetical protein